MSEIEWPPYLTYLIALSVILMTLLASKYFTKQKLLGIESGRKILHIVAIVTCGVVVNLNDSRDELACLFILFSILLWYLVDKNLLIPKVRKSYGIALFPLAFGILLLSPLSKTSILFAIFTLGLSDALGGIIGLKYGFKKLTFLFEPKSWLGFSIFYLTTCTIAFWFIGNHPVILILAVLPALSELFSYRGSDNFTIPLVSAIWYELVAKKTIESSVWISLTLIICILWLVHRKRWLTPTGLTAALLLAIAITVPFGPTYLLPMAFFFVLGSLTSKLIPKHKDSSGRDSFQVFANGLTATICFLIFSYTSDMVFLVAYLASVNISLSDTISSDIGSYYGKKTYDIITWKIVERGMSGGVSWLGTFAGIIAATVFGLFCKQVFNLAPIQVYLIVLTGVSGMLIDSVLGSVIQVKYMSKGIITEEFDPDSKVIKGFPCINNDGVNLLSNVVTLLILILYLRFFS